MSLIGRLTLAGLAMLVLWACVPNTEQGEAFAEREEPASTQPEGADPPAPETTGLPEQAQEELVVPPEQEPEEPVVPPEPAVPGCSGEGGFLAVTGSDGEVTIISPDGTVQREMRGPVRRGYPALQPTWAPVCRDGGHQIAWTEAAEDGTPVIAVGDAASGEVRRHASSVAPFYYFWSPDANLLAFLGQNAFSPIQMGVLNLATEEVEIVGEGQPFFFDWHQDSRDLVAHVSDRLAVLSLRDGAWSERKIPLVPGFFQAPAWVSADRILVVAGESPGMVDVGSKAGTAQGDFGAQRLIITDRDGTLETTLAELEGPAAFSPDPRGWRVAVSDLGGPLRVLDVRSGAEVAVSERRVAALQWSPDGSLLLFMELDSEARGLAPRVWDGTETSVFPSFVPTQVFLRQYLPFWDQYSRSLTLWSPDSRAFTYPAASPDGDKIMIQPLDAPQPTEVADGVFASWSHPSR